MSHGSMNIVGRVMGEAITSTLVMVAGIELSIQTLQDSLPPLPPSPQGAEIL
jgi:hypothetical protein